MEISDIKKLAVLARLELSSLEEEKYLKELGSILEYIGQIKDAPISDTETKFEEINNISRDDVVENTTGGYTESILALAPENEQGYFKVKKIL
jgi:aspartyl-tRNA(Asn)/glutamyl-tRNA(Gln) amidotransferase subunit C